MTHHTSIALNDHEAEFVERQVGDGHYASETDVLRAGLRMLEEHDAKVRALEAALIEGEKGPFSPFDPDSFLAELHAKHNS